MEQHANFSDLLGKTLVHIAKSDDNREIIIETSEGEKYKLLHYQDCCESVYVEDIDGDLDLLLGEPLVMAEEISKNDDTAAESGTWTFYKLANSKEYVTIRWYGYSNGYYSEAVSFIKIVNKKWSGNDNIFNEINDS